MSQHDELTEPGSPRQQLTVLGVRVSMERVVYSTVVLLSVLVVYDGWSSLTSFRGLAAVILAPMLALALAHLFAGVLEEHVVHQRPLTRHEWKVLLLDQVQVFVVALPPLVLVLAGWVSPLDAPRTLRVIVWYSVVVLGALALIAGWRAGLRGWRLVVACFLGALVGLVVVSLQVLLKPH